MGAVANRNDISYWEFKYENRQFKNRCGATVAKDRSSQLFELRKIETYVVLMKLGASIREIQVGGVFDWENLHWGDKGMAEDNFAFE